MKEEKRKIILKKGEPEQEFWFNKSFSASPGKVQSVDVKTALIAIESGKFDYVDEGVQIENNQPDLLAPDFPKRDELAKGNIKTLGELNLTSDEDVLKISGIGKESLKQIREAAVTGENNAH